MRVSGRALCIAFLIEVAVAAAGKPGLLGIAALGEATLQTTSDNLANTVLPQIGISVEYRGPFLAVFNTPSVGYYNGRPFLEDYIGVEAGWDFAWARPALTGGIGVQSWYSTKSRFEGEDSWLRHEVSFPMGVGLRLWLFQSFYGEWQGRMVREDQAGVPWWRMEFGYKVL